MLNPIVGTEMDFRSSLFLKKFTIVDLPELLRPMIRMLICFGFRSLFKIFINNFSKTIFPTFLFLSSSSKQVFWNVYFQIDENFLLCFGENIKHSVEMPKIQYDSLRYHGRALETRKFNAILTTGDVFSTENSIFPWFFFFSCQRNKLIQQSVKFMLRSPWQLLETCTSLEPRNKRLPTTRLEFWKPCSTSICVAFSRNCVQSF